CSPPLRSPPFPTRRSSDLTHIMSPRLSFLPLFFLLAGCQYSPSIYIAGSYFPAWLVCVAISIPITIALRVLLIAGGIDDYLPMRSEEHTSELQARFDLVCR